MRLDEICSVSEPLQVFCMVFSTCGVMSATIPSYVDNNKFGLQFEMSAAISFKSDFIDNIVGWPDEEMLFMFEVELENGGLAACATYNDKKLPYSM